MGKTDFWARFCKNCDKHCCRIGMPTVYPREKKVILAATGKTDYFEDHGVYSILKGQPCPFLGDGGRCTIHKIKPLDCKVYPLFLKPLDSSCEWMVDKDCPAHDKLPQDFVEHAKKLFLSLTPEQRKIDWKIVNMAGFRFVKLE